MIRRIVVAGLMIFFGAFIVQIQNVNAEASKFVVNGNIQKNNNGDDKSYFDLKMKAGEKRKISLFLSNTSQEDLVLAIKPNTAITNQNGVIDYTATLSVKKLDKSLQVSFSDLIKGPKKVTLKAGEKKEIFYEINMPEEKFDGMILGGFYISEQTPNETAKTKDNVMIKNKVSYAIAVVLSETDEKVTSELKLNQVKPALQNYRTSVTANIQNTQPEIIRDLEVTAKVSKVNGQEVIHETNKKDMKMAPNSNFDFPITWDNQALKPGKYILNLTADSKNGSWKFSKEFEITATDSRKLNQKAVEVVQDDSWLIWLSTGLGLLVAGLIGWIIVMKKRERKKRIENKRN